MSNISRPAVAERGELGQVEAVRQPHRSPAAAEERRETLGGALPGAVRIEDAVDGQRLVRARAAVRPESACRRSRRPAAPSRRRRAGRMVPRRCTPRGGPRRAPGPSPAFRRAAPGTSGGVADRARWRSRGWFRGGTVAVTGCDDGGFVLDRASDAPDRASLPQLGDDQSVEEELAIDRTAHPQHQVAPAPAPAATAIGSRSTAAGSRCSASRAARGRRRSQAAASAPPPRERPAVRR